MTRGRFDQDPDRLPGQSRVFATTHWSVVLTARDADAPQQLEALEILCRAYWYPLYSYIRRQGYSPVEVQDLTQEFFARLLEKDFLRLVDPARGRFRSFLIMALDRFLAKEWRRGQRQKRGGGQVLVSLDMEDGERRYAAETADERTPDKIFELRWALQVLDRALDQLRRESSAPAKRAMFDRVQGLLAGDGADAPYETLAAEVGLSVNAFKVAVHRMRQRYRELVRAEVLQTVSRPEEVDDEIRHLLAALTP
jgi:RNA polymerase sigma-70 factor (ECF subfamily)